MLRNNDYTTGNLLDYSYHQNYYKLIELTQIYQEKNFTIPQQISFLGKLKEDNSVKFFMLEKHKKIFLFFSLDSLNVTE